MSNSTFGFIAIAITLGLVPHAGAVSSAGKPKAIYNLNVSASNPQGSPVRFPKGGDGWRCKPTMKAISSGTLKDHAGKVQTREKADETVLNDGNPNDMNFSSETVSYRWNCES